MRVARILVIDNFDSFTYNLVDYLTAENGVAPEVVTNDEVVDFTGYDGVVISPGPGHPDRTADVGLSARALEADLPVLGVCLGHQLIATYFGGHVERAPEPVHGRVSAVRHHGSPLFEGLPPVFDVVRYHSLIVTELPGNLVATAHNDDGQIMALEHTSLPIYGVQFHPESVGVGIQDDSGRVIVRNFVQLLQPRLGVEVIENVELDAAAVGRIFDALYADDPAALWLDDSSAATMSYMGAAEHAWVTQEGEEGAFFSELNSRLASAKRPHDPGLSAQFQGGYVGYLGYELSAHTCHVSEHPDAWLGWVRNLIALDHVGERVEVIGDTEFRRGTVDVIRAVLAEPDVPRPRFEPPGEEVTLRECRTEYMASIEEILSSIDAGETYEVCLTTQLSATFTTDPLVAYHHLRSRHPSRTSGFLRCGDVTLCSVSPETFLSIDTTGKIVSRPIKGTRPRGTTPDEDTRLRDELATGEKERAENLMIVDLVRNDLTRTAVPGTVRVEDFCSVETYASVHQLVSTVAAQQRSDAGIGDVVKHAFPGGSMTGAPKIRTMEILTQLENGPRGPYSGAFGYFSATGPMDLAMTIRTLVVSADQATYGVGGAVLALSDVDEEYGEILTKSAPFQETV